MKSLLKISAVVMCLAMLLASCGGDGGSTSSVAGGTSSGTGSVGGTSSTTSTTIDNVNIFDTDVWQAVPMVSQEILNNGYAGGEGCQWPNQVELDPVEGKYALFGSDTGGVFRSEDGGVNWEPATLGLDNRGAVGEAFDPNNTQRVLLVGSTGERSGLYLSTDAAKTWSNVYATYLSRSHDWREQIAFDESSYDKTIGGSKVAYWLRANEEDANITKYNIKVGLYKSEDGGKTWNHVTGTEKFAGGWMAVNKAGVIFIANDNGIFKSTDGGKSFSQVFNTRTNSLCVIRSKGNENNVYAMTNEGLYLSKDAGATFKNVTTQMPGAGIKNFTFLEVSPANPSKMVMQNDTLSKNGDYSLTNYYSHDGGKTWSLSMMDKTTNVWAPFNTRQHPATFHPTNENIVLTLGADGITRSTDGGKTYKMSSVGYNVIMSGGEFFFNYNNPKLVAVSAQDYNGGFSTDGGKTWKYMDWSGVGWGGHTYGAYALTEKTVVAILSSAWASRDSTQQIVVTYDGGKTFTKTNIIVEGSHVVCGVKGDNNIIFAGEWRSTDGAKTWTEMNGCKGVFTCDTQTGWLFGTSDEGIVVSKDKGATWTLIFKNTDEVQDICYNPKHGKVYFTGTAGPIRYFKWTDGQELNNVWYSALSGIWSVCVDPTNMDIMYAAGYSSGSYTAHNVYRSLDGGKTWTGITRQVGDGRTGPDGANQANRCTVNPVTRELFVGSHCSGFWKIAAPPASATK